MNKTILLVGLMVGLLRAAFAQTELISNGGFESTTLSPWTSMTTAGWTQIGIGISNNAAAAHTGSYFLSMGNWQSATQGVYQLITIPTNAVVARLTYYWSVASSNPNAVAQLDSYIVDSGLNALAHVDSEYEAGINGTTGYGVTTYNLSNYLGQTVGVFFEVQTDPTFGNFIGFHIDDVSVLYATNFPANDNFASRTVLTGSTNVVTANNTFASKESGEPNHAGNSGGKSLWWAWTAPSNGVVTITTDGSSFDTLLAVYTGTIVSNLTQVAANNDDSRGVTSRVKFATTAGTQYQIAVDGNFGASGSVLLSLSFLPDTQAPKVTISSPAAGAKVTNSTAVVQGTATDNIAVAFVEYHLENANGTNGYQLATGTNSWTATVTNLIAGTNTVRVRATDTSGNVSVPVARSFQYVIVSPLTLTTNGSGTVTPALNGQLLQIGSTYTVTAKPLTGHIFAGWTGDVIANTAVLTFTMQSNLVLQANFIPNPFAPVAGVYQGLFYNTNDVEHESSGFVSATVSTAGKFTAKLYIAGKAASLAGQFSATGVISTNIMRKGLTPVSAQLQLDLGGGGLTGQLSDGSWTAQLNAFRAGTNLGLAGRYTVMLPGSDDSAAAPGGDGFGTAVVTSTGGLTFSGLLGDGTKVAQKVNLTPAGQWPFYVPLYSGNGSIFGWLTFAAQTNSDIDGAVSWFKLAQPAAVFYPAGFARDLEATGSLYVFTTGVSVLNFTTGQVSLLNGNLSASFTNQIAFGASNIVTNQSTNALKLTITTSTGLFKGTVVDPSSGRTIAVNGVLLQKQNFGSGYFLGTNQTGRVYFGP